MIKSIFKTVSFVADIISEIKNHEHNVRAMQDKMAQGIIDRVNEIEAEREANKVIPYNRTEEFQHMIHIYRLLTKRGAPCSRPVQVASCRQALQMMPKPILNGSESN